MITLFANEESFPYSRDAFVEFVGKKILSDGVLVKNEEFFATQKVEVVLDRKVTRLNLKRNKIFTEKEKERQQFDFDLLFITEMPSSKLPDIKGNNKIGNYSLQRLHHMREVVDTLPIIESIVVQGDSFWTLQIVTALLKRNKEVLLVLGEQSLLGNIVEEDAEAIIASVLEEKGLVIERANEISEVLGDTYLKAARLNSGKIYAGQMILFENAQEDLRPLAESPLTMNEHIQVTEHYQTNLDHVYALDMACQYAAIDRPLSILEQQASVAVAHAYQQECSLPPVIPEASLKLEDLSIQVIGQIEHTEGVTTQRIFDEEQAVYRKLFLNQNRIVGAVLVNADTDKSRILNLIQQQTHLSQPLEDVFGQPVAADTPTVAPEISI